MIETVRKLHNKLITITTAAFIIALVLHSLKPFAIDSTLIVYVKSILFAITFLSVPGVFAWYTGIKSKNEENETQKAKYSLIKVMFSVSILNIVCMALIPEKSLLFSSLIATFALVILKYE